MSATYDVCEHQISAWMPCMKCRQPVESSTARTAIANADEVNRLREENGELKKRISDLEFELIVERRHRPLLQRAQDSIHRNQCRGYCLNLCDDLQRALGWRS